MIIIIIIFITITIIIIDRNIIDIIPVFGLFHPCKQYTKRSFLAASLIDTRSPLNRWWLNFQVFLEFSSCCCCSSTCLCLGLLAHGPVPLSSPKSTMLSSPFFLQYVLFPVSST